jgi:hypothetical protein
MTDVRPAANWPSLRCVEEFVQLVIYRSLVAQRRISVANPGELNLCDNCGAFIDLTEEESAAQSNSASDHTTSREPLKQSAPVPSAHRRKRQKSRHLTGDCRKNYDGSRGNKDNVRSISAATAGSLPGSSPTSDQKFFFASR